MLQVPKQQETLIKDTLLYLGSFFIFLYIHLPLTLRFGFDPDEIIDYTGSAIARDTYLASGRWGIVVWGDFVGAGLKMWSGGATAGLILCFALLLQTKLLFQKNGQYKLKIIFCTLYLASCQFAYSLHYSMQAEAFALSILLATFACFILFYNQQTIKAKRVIFSTIFLFIGLSFYQTAGLLYYCLFCLCTLSFSRKKVLLNLAALCIACLGSLFLFYIAKKLILICQLPSSTAIEYTQEHLSHSLSRGIIYTKASLLHLLKNLFLCTKTCNAYLQVSFLISLLIISYNLIRQKELFKLCLVGITIATPYLFLLLMEPSPRMFSFLPLIAAFFIVQAITQLPPKPLFRHTGYFILAIFCIFGSHKVATQCFVERIEHDNNILERFAQYNEARKLMLQSGKQKAKIIVFEIGWNRKAPDFYHSYPFKNFHMGTHKDYDKHKETLNKMPEWPADGSIVINQGDVIIKGGLHW